MAELIESTDYKVITDDIVGKGGGGGCFRAGTWIYLEHNRKKRIEELKEGDKILCFDDSGRISLGEVTKLHIHDDPQPIWKYKFWSGYIYATPNHWVLNQYNAFVEIGTLAVDKDALVDDLGHLRPLIDAEFVATEPVYNLTVEPHHTFIANGIRVHNGGHRERYAVVGSGGGGGDSKGGGGGRSSVEDPDTLQSRANVKSLHLLGEGQLGGLVDGAKSIYLDGTPLMSASGDYNFKNVTWEQRTGTPNQSLIPGFSSVETPFNMSNIEVTNASPKTFTISSLNADRVRVIMNIPALMSQDMTTGDIHGYTVTYKFQISTDGGAYADMGEPVVITGKTRSKYQRSHVITLPKPATTGWTVKVVRVSVDETASNLANKTHIDSYVEIIDVKVNYANSAIVSLGIDPETFSSIPAAAFRVKGLYIRVPSNYNAATRVYTGIWDGSFILATSSNPAWILFDLLTAKRYGLGNQLADSQVDKAMVYTIGRYCDELIPDGFGGVGTEPRFTINTQIQTQAEAYKLIADITTVFRGMGFWNGGMVCLRHDAPRTPSLAFNQANVVEGEFNYMGSSRKDRHSVVNVTWNDPAANFKQRVEYVEDHELITTMGIRKLDTIAFGCTSRGQAHRVGKWILYSERYEANLITFKVGLDASLAIPGEVVGICDAFRAGKRMGGRVLTATTTSVTTDAPVTVTAGAVSIFIALPDGSFAERVVTQTNGTFSTFTWASALPDIPLANAVFVMSDQIVPLLARVVAIAQDMTDPNSFIITATEHNPNKYAAIELGILLRQPQTSIAMPYVVNITGVTIDESTYFIAPGVIGSKLHVSWEGRASLFRGAYRITINGGTSNWTTIETKVANFDIEGLKEGSIVDIKITGRNPLGEWVTPVTATYTIEGKTAPPAPPTGLTTTALIRSIALKWINPADIDFSHTEVYMSLTNDSGTATVIALSTSDNFLVTGLPPSAVTHYFWLKAVDTSGNKSAFNTVPGTSGTTLVEADYMVSLLAGKIAAANLTTELGTRINLIDGPEGTVGTVAYHVAQEAAARAAAVTAEATARGTAITNEQTLREDMDNALSQSISLLTASSSTGFDAGVMWYFDATVEGWTSAGATQAWNAGNVEVTSTGTDPQFISPAALDIAGSVYSVVKIRVKRLAGSGWDGTLLYQTGGHSFSSSYKKTVSAPSPFEIGDTAIIDFDMTDLTAGGTDWVDGTITQIRLDLGSTSSDVFAVDWVAIGRNGPAASTAGLLSEQTARISGDTANASNITALSTQVNHVDTGLPKTRSDLLTEQTTRATADTANSTAISALSAQVNHATTGLPQTRAELITEQSARADGDSANASSISALTTTVGGHTTTLGVQGSSIDGINAKYTVKIDNNGYVSGYGLISEAVNGVPVADFAVRADKFWIASPGASLNTRSFNATATGVNVSTDAITTSGAHAYSTGTPVVYTAVGGTAPAPLVSGTTYYVINVASATLKLATSLAAATAGTAINITAVGTGTAHTLSPSAFAPFMVLTTPTTIDGTVFDPGVYMDNAMITKLTASQIDTRGLTIRDGAGTIIFASGTPLDYASGNIANKPTSLSGINSTEGTKLTGIATGATKNTVFRQGGSVPSGQTGDIWHVTTTTSGYVTGATYLYVSGSWQISSDATASQLGGTGVNVLNPRYTTFEEAALPPISSANGTVTLDATVKYMGSKSLKMVASAADHYCYLSSSSGAYNVTLQPNKKWIISAYVRASVASASIELYLATSTAGAHYSVSVTSSATPNTWTRVSGVIDLTADVSPAAVMRVDNNTSGVTMWFDGLMLEAQVGALTTPSPYSESPNFLTTFIGDLNATLGADSSNLRVGSGVNLCPNADFANASLQRWSALSGPNWNICTLYANHPGWFPAGGNAVAIAQGNATSTGYVEIYSDPIPVAAGRRYEYFANTAAHACNVDVFVFWFDADNAIVGTAPFGINAQEMTGGTQLSGYKKTGNFGEAPATAAYGKLTLRKEGTLSGNSSYLFATQCYLGEALSNQTEFSAWSPASPSIGGLGYSGALDATKSIVYRQATAPTGGTYTTNDLWFDTDSSPSALYQWNGSSWAVVSNNITNTNQVTDGAGLGTTSLWTGVSGSGKPENNATVGANSSNLLAGVGTNLLYNPGLAFGSDGWTTGLGAQTTAGMNLTNWTLKSAGALYGAAYLVQAGSTNPATSFLYNAVNYQIPVVPGQRYEFSAFTGAHRCTVGLYLQWLNSAGSILSGSNASDSNAAQALGGTVLSGYKRLTGFGVAPAGAVSVQLVMSKTGTNAGQSDSYAFMTLPFVGIAGPNQTEFSPWSEGTSGINGQITTANASTYIANAAIGSAHIGNAAINSAHIGNAQVGNAHIADLSVNKIKIAGNSVSYVTKANATSLTITTHGSVSAPSSLVVMAKAYQDTGSTNGLQLVIGGTVYDTTNLSCSVAVGGTAVVQTTLNITTSGSLLIQMVQTGQGNTTNPVINVLEVMK